MSDALPQVLIVGAGDTGLALATVLGGAGLGVSTLNRSGRTVDGATPIVADLADPATLTGLSAADVVVFTTAPPTRDDDGYRVAYVDGPQRVLDALPREPARAILTSTTGVYGFDDGRWVTASTPAAPARATAELVVEGETALAARVPTTTVRAAGIYGPGRGRMIEQVRSGIVGVTPGSPDRWTNRVHRDDLAAALALCAIHPSPPPVAIAVDDEPVPRDRVLSWLAEQLDVELGPDPSPAESTTGKRCRNSELKDLGWEPAYPSFREGYLSILASL
ncbi:MAG: NAD-dependent epimerase/dehydratase family protein [Actinomycetota bacterium]